MLTARLYPIVTYNPVADRAHENVIRWHIADVYRAGDLPRARRLAHRHVGEALRRSRLDGPAFIIELLIDLRHAGLPDADVASFFPAAIVNLPDVRDRIEKLRLFDVLGPPGVPVVHSQP